MRSDETREPSKCHLDSGQGGRTANSFVRPGTNNKIASAGSESCRSQLAMLPCAIVQRINPRLPRQPSWLAASAAAAAAEKNRGRWCQERMHELGREREES